MPSKKSASFDLPDGLGTLEVKGPQAFLTINDPKVGTLKTTFAIMRNSTQTLRNMNEGIECLKLEDPGFRKKLIRLVTQSIVEYLTSQEVEREEDHDEEEAEWEENAQEYKEPETARRKIREVLALPDLIMPARKKHENVTLIGYKHLFSNGRFFFDHIGRRGFWFDASSKVLQELEGEKFQTFLSNRLGVNPEDRAFAWILGGVKVRTAEHAEKVEPRRFSFFDETKFVLYVSNKPGRMIRIDGSDSIQEVDNGTDAVVFLWEDDWEPFDYVEKHADNLGRDLIFSRFSLNDEETDLTLDELSILLDTYIQSVLFRTIIMHRPILAAVGPFGAGKTVCLLLIGITLFGPKFTVLGLEGQKEDGAIAYITNSVFGVFDNADEKIPWLADMLARIATGMAIPRRKLYHTNTLVTYGVDLFLGITARFTPWARADVISRLLLLRFKQPSQNINEKIFISDVLRRRGELLSEFIWDANLRIRMLKQNADKSFPSPSRLAGFYEFGMKTSVNQEQFRTAFLKVIGAQEALAQEQEEALVTVLQNWLDNQAEQPTVDDQKQERWTPEKLTSELLGALLRLGKDQDLDIGINGKNQAQQLGQKLKQNKAMLSSIDIVFKTQHTRRGTGWRFKLKAKSGEKSSGQEQGSLDSNKGNGNREGGSSVEKSSVEKPSQVSQVSQDAKSSTNQNGVTPQEDAVQRVTEGVTEEGGKTSEDHAQFHEESKHGDNVTPVTPLLHTFSGQQTGSSPNLGQNSETSSQDDLVQDSAQLPRIIPAENSDDGKSGKIGEDSHADVPIVEYDSVEPRNGAPVREKLPYWCDYCKMDTQSDFIHRQHREAHAASERDPDSTHICCVCNKPGAAKTARDQAGKWVYFHYECRGNFPGKL